MRQMLVPCRLGPQLSLATAPGDGGPADFGTQSCEQITRQIRARHGEDRWIECKVLEDGILGGRHWT